MDYFKTELRNTVKYRYLLKCLSELRWAKEENGRK